jgi:hypothetical protein
VKVKANYAEALKSIMEAISLKSRSRTGCPEMFSGELFSAYRALPDVPDGLGRTEEAINLRQQFDEAASAGQAPNDG